MNTITFEEEVNKFNKGIYRMVEIDSCGKKYYSAYPFSIWDLPLMIGMMHIVNSDYKRSNLSKYYSFGRNGYPWEIRGDITTNMGNVSVSMKTRDGERHCFSLHNLDQAIRAYEDFARRFHV